MTKKIKYWITSFYPFWLGLLFGIIDLNLKGENPEASFYLIIVPILLIVTSPVWGSAVYLLLNYEKYDKEITSIEIESENILINVKGIVYQVNSIDKVMRNPKMDLGFDFLPWSKFFYFQLKCEQNKIFHVSCLSPRVLEINPTNVLYKKYPSIPFQGKKMTEDNSESFLREMNHYIKKYKNRSQKELEEIINSSKYSDVARIAAEKLLNKNVDNTV